MAKGFKKGAGGAIGLNFKVVGGTAQPARMSENTIWINTSTKISSWVFSATEPTSPAEGMVWIHTNEASACAFNALKKNNIQVYPNSAKQYISGVWVDVGVKVYQGGKLSGLVTYLYNKGNEYAALTGGWFGKKWEATWSPNAGTMTKNAAGISLSARAQQNIKAQTENKISFTNKNTLYVNVTDFSKTDSGGMVDCCISLLASEEHSVTNVNCPVKQDIAIAEQYAVDVSSVSGDYYVAVGIGCGASGACNVTFDEVRAV